MEKREQHDDPETGLAERLEALEEILNELRAQGIAVDASDLGEQRVALYLVSSEQVDVARAIVEEEFLPQLEVDLAADVRTQRISDLLQRTAEELLVAKGTAQPRWRKSGRNWARLSSNFAATSPQRGR